MPAGQEVLHSFSDFRAQNPIFVGLGTAAPMFPQSFYFINLQDYYFWVVKLPFRTCEHRHIKGGEMISFSLAILAFAAVLVPARADTMPVTFSTSGVFSNPTGRSTVSGNQWLYDGAEGFVMFNGVAPSSHFTPFSFSFGTITLTNTSNQPTDTFTADLGLTVSFTTPGGQTAHFIDGLQLTAKSGSGSSGHGDTLELLFEGFPGPQTFTFPSTEKYTVTYDGFYDSGSNKNTPLSSLFVLNNNEGQSSATAYLWGTITSEGPGPIEPGPVPEPGSVVLLSTVVAGIALSRRRKRA